MNLSMSSPYQICYQELHKFTRFGRVFQIVVTLNIITNTVKLLPYWVAIINCTSYFFIFSLTNNNCCLR